MLLLIQPLTMMCGLRICLYEIKVLFCFCFFKQEFLQIANTFAFPVTTPGNTLNTPDFTIMAT